MRAYIPEGAMPIDALTPAADAAGRNGRWINMALMSKVAVICSVNQGNAAQVTLSIEQATSAAGAGAKALAKNAPVWATIDADAALGDIQTRQADGVSFQTDVGLKKKVVTFLIDDSMLDVAGGFAYIRVKTSASNAANITGALYVPQAQRYQGASPPSAIV
jgi:hypothetical protein